MNDSLPTSSRPSAHVDHAQVVTTWLTAFEDALSAADESALANLIEKDGHWRVSLRLPGISRRAGCAEYCARTS